MSIRDGIAKFNVPESEMGVFLFLNGKSLVLDDYLTFETTGNTYVVRQEDRLPNNLDLFAQPRGTEEWNKLILNRH